MSEKCDVCGPYTIAECVAAIRGEWQPLITGHLCAMCAQAVSETAKELADRVDAECEEFVMSCYLRREE